MQSQSQVGNTMMHKNTDEKRRNHSILLLWSKVVFAVFLFVYSGFQAQITISGDAQIYVGKNVIVSENDSVSKFKGEIFSASGAIIYHSDSGNNYQIVQQKPSKPEIKEESALKIAEIQKEKKQKEKIASIKIPVQQKKEFFSNQKSDESFDSDNSFSSDIVQTPTYQLKDFIHVKFLTSLVFNWKNSSETHFYSIENQKKQVQYSFFTRPPPFLI